MTPDNKKPTRDEPEVGAVPSSIPDTQWLDEIFDDIRLTCDECDPPACTGKEAVVKQAILTHESEQIRLGKVGLLEQFAEYCHEHYLGCGKNTLTPDGFEYSYDNEIINLIDPFVESLTESVK